MPIAQFIKNVPNKRGDVEQALYLLDEPLHRLDYSWEQEKFVAGNGYDYVIVSASRYEMLDAPETYIFGADAEGEIIDWTELPGSTRGTLQHSEALQRAGYLIRYDLIDGKESE